MKQYLRSNIHGVRARRFPEGQINSQAGGFPPKPQKKLLHSKND
ncbi:hypothetical protein SZ54_1085 [Rhizobium sp. UR51a]|nr:hypothetical protein SZ54_1085 [Rhizobium sp. UR51a]